jgi:hypothetical protein
MPQLTAEQMSELNELDRIHITWRDYALMLVNSTGNNGGLRDIWHEKILTSFEHWNCKDGSISEVNINGLEVLTELPSDFTKSVVDDHYERDGEHSWKKLERLAGSKRMKVHVGKYPQESLSNEAYLCLKVVMQDMGNLEWMVWQSPLLTRMWKLAQMTDGAVVTQDEMLTYILERHVDDTKYGSWIPCAVEIALKGPPSKKYEKYWKTAQIEGFPLHAENQQECLDILSEIVWDPSDQRYSLENVWNALERLFDVYRCSLSMQEQIKNMDFMCQQRVLREDVSYSPCWKKIAICVLKNDVSFKFCGFGATLRERQAREEAIAAFDTKQEEREKAKAEALRIAEQRKKEMAQH